MAAKKKNKKKSTPSKKSASRKSTPAKKQARKRTTAKKSAKRTAAPNKAKPKKQGPKQTTGGKTAKVINRSRSEGQGRGPSAFLRETTGSHSGEQSGDLQGLSDVESADSESVDELMEEGNAFEAGVISGVERAGEREGREVHTREVPEDDVPGEYLDED
jgi:hypothetical protein